MKYGLLFTTLGLLAGYFAWRSWASGMVPAFFYAQASVSLLGVGSAYLGLGPAVLQKRSDGTIRAFGALLFWPYHVVNWLGLWAVALVGKEAAVTEVRPGLLLGRRWTGFDGKKSDPDSALMGVVAVLDLTAEFPEHPSLRRGRRYRCIPLLDTYAPTVTQLCDGIEFLREAAREGTVLVHCALGHGRSATFVAAYLLAAGWVGDVDEAERLLRERRPGVKLHPEQRRVVAEYARRLRVG